MFRNIIFVAISIFFLFIVFSSAGCDGQGNGSADGDGSLPQLTVKTVLDLGTLDDNSMIQARDCGFSAVVEGKSVWIFGDTILETENEDDSRVLCNSWSIIHDVDAADGIAGLEHPVDSVGAPKHFFSFTDQERKFNELHAGKDCQVNPCNARWAIWPGAIVPAAEAGLAYVFYHKVYSEPGVMNFYHVGHSVSVWKNFDNQAERPVFGHFDEYPTLMFAEGKEGFGSAALLDSRTLYVFGCELDEETPTKPCRLARVELGDILDKDSWRYLSDTGEWSSSLDDAAVIFYGSEMMSVFYSSYADAYFAIYSQPMSTKVLLRSARTPQGPWSEPVELFSAQETITELGWVYDAIAHPEFSENGGKKIYITYSRHTATFRSEIRLVMVELELL